MVSLGRTDDGLAFVDQEPDEILRLWGQAMVYQALGHRAESEAAIQSMIEKDPDGAAYQIAIAYAALGDSDAAFKWLERARAQGDLGLHEIRSRRDFQPLYSDPRWDQFLKGLRSR